MFFQFCSFWSRYPKAWKPDHIRKCIWSGLPVIEGCTLSLVCIWKLFKLFIGYDSGYAPKTVFWLYESNHFFFVVGQLMHALFFQKMHVVAKLLCIFFFRLCIYFGLMLLCLDNQFILFKFCTLLYHILNIYYALVDSSIILKLADNLLSFFTLFGIKWFFL